MKIKLIKFFILQALTGVTKTPEQLIKLKKGLNDFRGLTAGIGTSFADNLVLDIRNEFNIKGRIIGKLFSLPVEEILKNS